MGERDFGFITAKGREDAFLHMSDCASSFDDLGEGDGVEFELTELKGHRRAMKVKRIR